MNKVDELAVIKACRIGWHLLRRPRYAASYFLQRTKSPTDLRLPWIAYDAIAALDQFLTSEMTVFEFGSGGSTLFFADRCKSVTAIEDEPGWAAQMCERVATLPNVTLRHCPTVHPYKTRDIAAFEASDFLRSIDGVSADVILVDNGDEWTLPRKRREICFERAESHVRPGGVIVLDDAWAYRGIRSKAKRHLSFRGLGPCRTGATQTDLYFY